MSGEGSAPVSPSLEPTGDQSRRELAVLPPSSAEHREGDTARGSPRGEHPGRFLIPAQSRGPGEEPENEERTPNAKAKPRDAVKPLERPGQAMDRLRGGRTGLPPDPTA